MTSSAWTRTLVALLIAFVGWCAWLMLSVWNQKQRREAEAVVIGKLKNVERSLADIRDLGATVAIPAPPETAFARWRTAYLNHRSQVSQLDAKNPLVQRVMDSLGQMYSYVARTEAIRQGLLRGGYAPEEAAMLEAEFRSNIDLALAAVKEAQLKLRSPGETQNLYAILIVAGLLAAAAAILLWVARRQVARGRGAEIMLQDLAARLRSVEDAVKDGIVTLDDQWLIQSANPVIERMFGYDAEELVGRSLLELIPALRGPQAGQSPETIGRRRDGVEIPVELEVKRVPIEGETMLLAFVREVVDRPQTAAAMPAEQRMEFAAHLAGRFAHNFNNLLTSVTGYTDLLLNSLSEEDPIRKDLEEIRKAAERAALLTAEMLAISGKQVLRPQSVDLNELVARVAEMLPALVGEKIRVKTSTESRMPTVVADPAQLEQALIKLAVNARDAMPDGGELTLGTSNLEIEDAELRRVPGLEARPYAVLEVRDTGCGMDEDTQARVFEPFFTTKKIGKGMGLGLASVWGVVRQSGGVIDVESQPGRGSAFRIYLPQPRATSPGDAASGASPGSDSQAILMA